MTDYCTSCLYEDYDGAEEPCINCVRAKDKKPTEYFPKRPTKPITNYDRLISKTPEEMAIWISAITWCEYCPIRERCDEVIQTRFCKEILLEWLRAEVSE